MKESKQIKAALYLRVSSLKESVNSGNSFQRQERTCREFCTLKEMVVSNDNVYKDIDEGSTNIKERPGFKALLEAGREKKFDIVVIYSLDRLAQNVYVLISLERELRDIDISLRSATDDLDTSKISGRLRMSQLASISERGRKVS